MRIQKWVFSFLLMGLLTWSCSEEKVPERYYPRSDHDAYWYSLKQANLLSTALGQEWVSAAKKPFENQIVVELPYREVFKLEELKPDAIGYRFSVKSGEKVLIDISLLAVDSTHVFIDLFRVENDSLKKYLQVASADSALNLGFEPRKNADYVLRIQPELLRGGHFDLTIQNVPSLEFPVTGRDVKAIRSFFGDPRDGGRRDHHGVDIFAPRHTPIIAPVDGYVRFVGVRGMGGKVIWLYDSERRASLYFAHLENQRVKRYSYVKSGDTLGTVGNSGNASTTSPHLHFGIYRNGPIDPYYFIVRGRKTLPISDIPAGILGRQLMLNREILLKKNPTGTEEADTISEMEEVGITALNHKFARVRSASGKEGYISLKEILGEVDPSREP